MELYIFNYEDDLEKTFIDFGIKEEERKYWWERLEQDIIDRTFKRNPKYAKYFKYAHYAAYACDGAERIIEDLYQGGYRGKPLERKSLIEMLETNRKRIIDELRKTIKLSKMA